MRRGKRPYRDSLGPGPFKAPNWPWHDTRSTSERLTAMRAELDQLEAEVRDGRGLGYRIARRALAHRWPFHRHGFLDRWLQERTIRGPGRIHRTLARLAYRPDRSQR